MKKIFLLTVISLLNANVFSQDTTGRANLKSYYLQKSKNQRTTGWVLLGVGTSAIIISIVSANNNPNDVYSVSNAEGFALVGGVLLDLASIPFFISAGNNKGFAAAVAISNQPLYFPHSGSVAVKYAPGLTLKIGF